MPKNRVKAYRIIKWFTHHEPVPKNKRQIVGGLSYWTRRVHAGKGRMIMRAKYGSIIEDQAVGFFDRLQQRTAQLPVKFRSWILDSQGQPASDSLLAHEYGLSIEHVGKMLSVLVEAKWLALQVLKPNNSPVGSPTGPNWGSLKEKEKEKEKEKNNEKDQPPNGGQDFLSDFSSGDLSSSPSASRPPNKQLVKNQIRNFLRLRMPSEYPDEKSISQAKSDITTVENQIDHFWNNQHIIKFSLECAYEISNKKFIEKPISIWVLRLKREKFFYTQHTGSTA